MIKVRIVRLLEGSVVRPTPRKIFMIFDLLRSFLVYSLGEIAKVERPTAKPSCCV